MDMNFIARGKHDEETYMTLLVDYRRITVRLSTYLLLAACTVAGWCSIADAATCYTCHGPVGTSTDLRPVDAAYRNISTGGLKGSHTSHMPSATTAVSACAPCHVNAASYSTKHRDGFIQVSSVGYSKGKSFAQSGAPTLGTCNTASCHANPYGADLVTTPVWGTSAGCAACHNGGGAFTGTGTAPATGSHNKHMAASAACADCHTGAVAGSNGGTAHIDGNIDVTGGYPANVTKHTAGTYTGTCSTASCHDNGKGTLAVTPTWGASAVPACTACHELIPGDSSHAKHVTGTQYKKALCGDCHTGYVQGTTAAANHRNGTVEVNVGGYTSPKAKGSAVASCATSYCHSSGQSANGTSATPVYAATAPTWGGTVACGSCHATTGLTTGTHAKHLAVSTNCGNCHTGATASTYNSTTHVDGQINIASGFSYSNQVTPGNGYSSCSATVCHSSAATPLWGVNTAYDTCTKCHGTATVTVTPDNRYVLAPSSGTLTGTGQVSSSAKVGAHQTHLRYFNGFSNYSTIDYRCQNCHGTLPVSGNHANGSSAPVFQGLATKFGTYTAAKYVSGTGSCAVYCHNPAKPGGTLSAGNTGTGPAPVWTDAAYITDGTAKTAQNCDKCHLSPNNSRELSTVYSHSTVALTDNCTGCHGHNGDATGVAGRRHMDGIKYGNGSCNNCHGYPPLTSTQLSARAGGEFTDAKMESYSGGGGYHVSHVLASVTISDGFTPCLPCHPSTTHNQGGGIVSRANVNVNDNASDMTFRFDDSRAKRYNKTTMSCSNISCHFQPTPAW